LVLVAFALVIPVLTPTKTLALAGGVIVFVLSFMSTQIALYVLIFAIAAYWGMKGQLLYFWDELVWLLGFGMIDWNIRDWRRPPRRPLSASPSTA
jgi:hypothetical protein